ncbi:hypothetical protein CAEBREN_17458 [Caenorhabditis brenneri]|uniref:Uncharacterized protein n=1 Tax=Caenorhabditis brenneri TaxID=135651 RepID=G0MGT7_CAEBE|nr:hypothetical protein CAEBREN_17458 [Caenorhabditis brenneri]
MKATSFLLVAPKKLRLKSAKSTELHMPPRMFSLGST